MVDSTPPAGGSQAPASPEKKGRSSLVWWGYLANHVMLGAAAIMIVSVMMEGEGRWWLKLGLPVVFISMAIVNLSSCTGGSENTPNKTLHVTGAARNGIEAQRHTCRRGR